MSWLRTHLHPAKTFLRDQCLEMGALWHQEANVRALPRDTPKAPLMSIVMNGLNP